MKQDDHFLAHAAVEGDANVKRQQTVQAIQICPNCSTFLCEDHCKLACPRCGYFLSCSDFY